MTDGREASQGFKFALDEGGARELDAGDPLARFREAFYIPHATPGQPLIYLAGNSLGLQPRAAAGLVNDELDDWAQLAVDAHFDGKTPWYRYHEVVRTPLARLVGAQPAEVVAMNSLTVNLHLMMVSFYRPTRQRYRILIEHPAFPSDLYAVKTQIAHHGFDPDEGLIEMRPRDGEVIVRMEDLEERIFRDGGQIALVLMSAVNYFTGQLYELPRIVAAGHRMGCVVGFDLAHAAGNVPLALHEWDVDFAAWCSYKYLNSGPGAVAGCFVHERHASNRALPRFGGWWGNDPDTRFRMHLESEFVPLPTADGWQLSNPPILALAPLRASLALFDEAGMPALREKSVRLTGYLDYLIQQLGSDRIEVLTPAGADVRGCQLSLRIRGGGRDVFRALSDAGVVCDFREPDAIRVAPVPLYNTFTEVWKFAEVLKSCL